MKRFGIEADDTTQFKNADMYEQYDGEYVLYSDHRNIVNDLHDTLANHVQWCGYVVKCIELENELKAIKEKFGL